MMQDTTMMRTTDAEAVPLRISMRATREDRERITIVAKSMAAQGRLFVSYTDAIREALKRAAMGATSEAKATAADGAA